MPRSGGRRRAASSSGPRHEPAVLRRSVGRVRRKRLDPWGHWPEDPLVATTHVTAGSFGAVASEGIELVADLGHHLTVRVLDSKRMVSSDEPVRPHKRDGSHHTSSVDTGADPEAGVSASNLSF